MGSQLLELQGNASSCLWQERSRPYLMKPHRMDDLSRLACCQRKEYDNCVNHILFALASLTAFISALISSKESSGLLCASLRISQMAFIAFSRMLSSLSLYQVAFLFLPSLCEAKIPLRIIIWNVSNHLFDEGQFLNRKFAVFHILAKHVAELPAEILMTWVGEERTTVGEHANEAT